MHTLSSKAYTKLILHAHKYPFAHVNGFLVGRTNDATQTVTITDAFPLFHTTTLAAMFEVAAIQVEEYCEKQGISIVGYYFAHENFTDNSIDFITKRIGDKIALEIPLAILLQIDNAKCMAVPTELAVSAITRIKGADWKVQPFAVQLDNEAHSLHLLRKALGDESWNKLYDFDNHFDDLANDWTNTKLNGTLS
jgi:hypothetical protein